MKRTLFSSVLFSNSVIIVLVFLFSFNYGRSQISLSGQKTPQIISYQGLLTGADGIPVKDGLHEISMTLFNDESGNNVIWQGKYKVYSVKGIFSVRLGDLPYPLPDIQKMDTKLWLGISVDNEKFLKPLTPLTSSPYALNVPDKSITTEKIADGAVTAEKIAAEYISSLKLNGEKLGDGNSSLNIVAGADISITFDKTTNTLLIGHAKDQKQFSEKEGTGPQLQTSGDWKLEGNTSTTPNGSPADFLGTKDNVDLAIRVNDQQIMRYIPTGGSTASHNILGGYKDNEITAGAQGSIIAGGGAYLYINKLGSVDASVISGGKQNIIKTGHQNSVIAGGRGNTIGYDTDNYQSWGSTISGGEENYIGRKSDFSTVGGGNANIIGDLVDYGFIGGGDGNNLSHKIGYVPDSAADYSVIGGGKSNTVRADYAGVLGGKDNSANGLMSIIGGGINNTTNGEYSVIGGGGSNIAADHWNTIGGGYGNQTSSSYAYVGGGISNSALNYAAVVSGGVENTVGGKLSFIGSGYQNKNNADTSSIINGSFNQIDGKSSLIGGGISNTINEYAEYSSIVGGTSNLLEGKYSVIGGGSNNRIWYAISDSTAKWNGILGGKSNDIAGLSSYSTVSGGYDNNVATSYANIAGGIQNSISYPNGIAANIGGGEGLVAKSYAQTVIGFYNIPQGSTQQGVKVQKIGDYDDRVFIIGNGINFDTLSNAFEVSYNGHSIVYDRNGSGNTRPAIRGATYTDNIIYAWGNVNGLISCNFGANIVNISPGRFRITVKLVHPYTYLPKPLTCASITATLSTGLLPDELSGGVPGHCDDYIKVSNIDPATNTFDVYTGLVTHQIMNPTGTPYIQTNCIPTNLPFNFKVTGTPEADIDEYWGELE